MKPIRPFYQRPVFYIPTGIVVIIGLIFLVGLFSVGEYVITGHTPAILRLAKYLRHINRDKQVEAIVGLKIRNEKDLDDLIASQADPSSQDFRKFLTTTEFISRFSPTVEDLKKVENHLKSKHLEIVDVSANRLLVRIRGSAQNVEEAFKVTLNEYRYGNKTGICNDRNPSIPADLKDIISCVIGLNDFASFQALHRANAGAHGTDSPSGYGPREIAAAYNHPNGNNPAATGSTYSGKGVTVAIATAYTYDIADVKEFWKQSGIVRTGSVTNVAVNGSTKELNIETTLDLQQVGAQAPGADIIMYQGKDPSFITFTLVFNQIVADNTAGICTVSWGLCEKNTGAAEMETEHLMLKEGAVQGISFFIASGDGGAYDCSPNGTTLGVDYPSSDPSVTAVGGTTLHLNGDGTRKDESAWSGAGGGISANYGRPSWQTGPGLPDNHNRNTSDVALVGDPVTGYSLFFEGEWHKSGGTSFGAPNWGSIWALATEACGTRLGPCAPVAYRIGRSDAYKTVFFDIIEGNNGDGRGPGYNCGPGWDHPTGWGTVNVTNLIAWLKNDTTKKAGN